MGNKENYDVKFKKTNTKFFEYLQDNYDLTYYFLKIKFDHTYNVVDYAERIAKAEGLDQENVYIAKLVALFHDIGHFEQRNRNILNISNKTNIDHGDLGVEMLFNDILDKDGNIVLDENGEPKKLISIFLVPKKYYDVIRKAIQNHGKYKIDETDLDEKELMHSKIIRDADKLDIYRLRAYEDEIKVLERKFKKTMENDLLSDKVYERLIKGENALVSDFKTSVDYFMNTACFAYDLEFDGSLQTLLELGFLKRMQELQKFNNPITQDRVNKIYSNIYTYIDKRLRERENTKTKEENGSKEHNNEIPIWEKEKIIGNLLYPKYKERKDIEREREE